MGEVIGAATEAANLKNAISGFQKQINKQVSWRAEIKRMQVS